MSLSPAQKDELLALIHSGQKMVAVKRYREITSAGLQEALYAVTRLAEVEASGGGTRTQTAIPLASAPALDPRRLKQAEEAALAALRENNVMEAIKRYREHTRLGLMESKEAVDALSVVHRSNGRIGAKLAQALIAQVVAGRKEEALTLLMSNTGYDDAEARALIRNIGNMRPGVASCATGCLKAVLAMALIAGLTWVGLRQLGLI